MTRFALGLVAALALAGAVHAKDMPGGGTAGGAPPLDAGLAQQLQPTMKAFEDAWNRHDPEAMSASFADDAVLINPSGRVASGRAEITKLFEDEHARGPLKGTEFRQRITGARQVAPGLAFLDSEMTITGGRAPNGEALPEQHVHGALLLARQQDGRWQVLEGRPYALLPAQAPRGVAAGAAPSSPTPGARPPQLGTGSSGEDPSHTGP